MTLTYKERVIKALASCTMIDEVTEIEDRIPVTPHINRRKADGRKLTEELLTLCNRRKNELSELEPPF